MDPPIGIEGLTNCIIPEIKRVPNGATAFIGHAYGSPLEASSDDFLAENVLNFIIINKHLLSSIIFTGDVFSVPSYAKWRQLDDVGADLIIHVAPGNHDVLRPDSREAFQRSPYGQLEYPRSINTINGRVILEDSISTDWTVSAKAVEMINSDKSTPTIVARHNIPVKELILLANNHSGFGTDLDTVHTLNKKILHNKTVWIIGDSGAFSEKPRLKCLNTEKHMFIMNGIGETEGDTVLLASEGNLYAYVIE